ncbi:hypothetical protein ONE63_008178 [Megalurothrips usitatus]|uniref:Uncharacterized protein n=1 Tax=Megalurothrips usitatus TaxID=439358 RepID=A0AAV7XNY6_9NEOP|nr:hypothetical protein ONE63_008178 [Megalurothrips usitatus]
MPETMQKYVDVLFSFILLFFPEAQLVRELKCTGHGRRTPEEARAWQAGYDAAQHAVVEAERVLLEGRAMDTGEANG